MVDGGQLNIGDRLWLASTPVGSHMFVGPAGVLDIGDDVSIGHGAAIAAMERVCIGDGTRIGPFVIIMDTNFHGGSGDQSLQHDCRPVMIGKGCRIGSRVTITRGATIGDGAEILAGSVVTSSIPPGVCAAGARARVIGKAGDAAARWDSVAAALPDMFMAELGLRAPPDLDDTPLPAESRTAGRVAQLLAALERSHGVRLNPAVAHSAATYAELAAAVQGAAPAREPADV